MNRYVIFTLALCFGGALWANEIEGPLPEGEEAELSASTDEDVSDSATEEESDTVESIVDEWRRTLTFGIDSEVLELIPQLRGDGRDEVAEEVVEVMGISLNTEVRVEALKYLTDLEIKAALAPVSEFLTTDDADTPSDIIQHALWYVDAAVDEASPELREGILRLAEGRDVRVASTAVRTLGAIGDEETVSFLLELYERRGTPEQVLQSVLLSLGELGSAAAEDLLLAVAEDDAAESTSRYYAIDSLSKIGSEAAIDLFERLLNSKDAILRSYAVAALARYEEPGVSETLIRALRDSFWRVRVSALQGLAGRGAVEALPAVQYKLERDPEMRVRYEAVKTVAKIGTDEAMEYLRTLYVDERTPVTVRNSIAEQLIHEDLDDSLAAIATVIDQEWEREGSALLDYAAKELSQVEAASLKDLYARLLTHPNFIFQIYAIRGIGLNDYEGFREELTTLADQESVHRAVRSNARASLDALE